MKNIWMVYPYGSVFGETGKACRYTQFGAELARAGYTVIWWTANFSHLDKRQRADGWKDIPVCAHFITRLVPTTPYQKNISLGRIAFEKAFAKNLKAGFEKMEQPDLMLVAGTGMFNAFEPCCSYAKKRNIPLLYDIMDISLFASYMQQHHRLLTPAAKAAMAMERRREKRFFRYISGICALGKNQLEYAKGRAFHRDLPTCLVYNGIEVEQLRSMEQIRDPEALPGKKEDGWIWCIYSGNLGPSYDISTVIDCAKRCETRGDHIRFLIAGSGAQGTLAAEAAETCRNIAYLGQIDLETLFSVYKMCDIGLCAFASFSTVDMPDKFYDYCAAGLAVANTLQGEVKELIAAHRLGCQYEAGNAESLYRQLKALAEPETLQQCKTNAYDIGMTFDITVQVRKLTAMVREVLHD